jgi:hypothetical protein
VTKERDPIEDVFLEIIENIDQVMDLIENLEGENRSMLLDAVTAIFTSVTKLEKTQLTVERSVPVQLIDLLDHRNETEIREGVPWGISITATDENETKLNMQMFKLSIVMAFIQDNPVQPFNPFGENRSQSVAHQIRQY